MHEAKYLTKTEDQVNANRLVRMYVHPGREDPVPARDHTPPRDIVVTTSSLVTTIAPMPARDHTPPARDHTPPRDIVVTTSSLVTTIAPMPARDHTPPRDSVVTTSSLFTTLLVRLVGERVTN